MKKAMRRIVTAVISLTLILGLASTAFAATTDTTGILLLDVFVNGKQIPDVQAYKTNTSDTVFVSQYKDLYKIFPTEAASFIFPIEQEPTPLKFWADEFGYKFGIKDGTNDLYIYNDGSGIPGGNDPVVTIPETVKIFVNGNQITGINPSIDANGTVYLSNLAELLKVFPNETKGMNFPSVQQLTPLKEWATQFSYSMTVNGYTVILTKQGNGSDPTVTIPELVKIFVDGKQVSNVNAYLDDEGVVYLANYQELFKVFPNETKGMNFPTVQEPTRLKHWANEFSYKMTTSGYTVILTKESDNPVQNPGNNDKVPTPTKETPAIYVNGMKIANVTPSIHSEVFYVNSYSELRKVFPKETQNLSFPTVQSPIAIKEWADTFGYTCITRGYRVYLNNDGRAPMEIYINSALVNFPDQQPFATSGRTLIPVRAISETLGYKVDWGEGGFVTITNSEHSMTLIIGAKTFTIDGQIKTLDVPAQVLNNRTMVPIRFVAEEFGYAVGYNGDGPVKIVTLSK